MIADVPLSLRTRFRLMTPPIMSITIRSCNIRATGSVAKSKLQRPIAAIPNQIEDAEDQDRRAAMFDAMPTAPPRRRESAPRSQNA